MPKNLKNLEKTEDIKVEKIYFSRIRFLGNALSFEVSSFFHKVEDSFDIIHIPNGFFILHRPPKNAKIVSTIHDINPILPRTKNLSYILKDRIWRYIALKRGIKYYLKISSVIIANSSQTKEEIINLNISKHNVSVVNLGLDKRFLARINKNKIKSGKFKIGYIGSFGTNKNVDFILQAAKLLKDKRFYLWGARNHDYEALLEKANALNNVKFMGFAPEDKIVSIYDSFSVFVFPSLYEGFGIPIIEAQSRGLPVIIYKYGKIPKEVRKYCFEAESPEHMAQIIEDLKKNGYNEKLRKKATEYAKSFTWKRCAKETLNAYREVLK